MRVLKAILVIVPLLLLGAILAVGVLDNLAVKERLTSYSAKKGMPLEVGKLDLSLPKAEAVFEMVRAVDPVMGFTASVERVVLTLDESELAKGRRSVFLSATNATIMAPCDFIGAISGKSAVMPLSESGSLLNYSAEKVELGKLPYLLSQKEKSKDPLYIKRARIEGGSVFFQGRTKPFVWDIVELDGQDLAVPPEKAENPQSSWLIKLRENPATVFQGFLTTENNVKTLKFALNDLPAEILGDLVPEDYGNWVCEKGLLSAEGELHFQGKELLPGTIKLKMRGLDLRSSELKNKKVSIPAVSLENANLDLEVTVDNDPPYFHLTEAWENQKTKVESGRFQMTLDLKF
ncbi:hypothetical protein IKS73_09035 [bacterium]|nr:hypothetical protein [bacterium]